LTGEELKEHGDDFWKCDLGKVSRNLDITVEEALGSVKRARLEANKLSTAYLLGVEVITLEVSFLLGNGRPKLDRLQRDRLFL
jgi:hypothetical protein